ncbi:MFS transporter [Paenibacillus puerhi]|uniref:MFS transporter n=1 Tax=Paenibacillus puerhi TaxID=2692622 RepID=UPI00135C144B|nr:MFS transporter [Paenibacillus puerhi]
MRTDPSKYSMHLYIFVFYMTQGAFNPYLSYWFAGQGLDNKQIGLLFSVGPVLGLFIQPLWGMLCDRYRLERVILILSTVLAPVFAYGYLAAGPRFAVYMLAAWGLALTYSAMSPIGEALTVRHAEKHGFSYGGIRMLGSISFALTSTGMGMLYARGGLVQMFSVYAGLMALLLVTLLFMEKRPGIEARKRTGSLLSGIRPFLAQRRLLLFLLLVFGISLGSAANNVFFPVYVGEMGEGAAARIGLLNTIAALSELPLFLLAGRLIARFGPFLLLTLVGTAASLRWLLLSTEPPFWLLATGQLLHGVTFALFMTIGIRYMHETSPPQLGTTAQTLFAVVSANLAMLVASNTGGWLIDSYGFPPLYRITAGISMACAIGFALMLRGQRRQSALGATG